MSDQYTVMNIAMSPVNYDMVVRSSDRELYAWCKALGGIARSGAYKSMHDKWILDWIWPRPRPHQPILTAGSLIAAAVAVELLFITLINRTLSVAVAEKTAASVPPLRLWKSA